MLSILSERIVSCFVAELLSTEAGHFGCVGLCQLCTKLKILQCETSCITNTDLWCCVIVLGFAIGFFYLTRYYVIRIIWRLRKVWHSCGRCSMLLQVLLAAYGNTRKEEVTSVGVFHHLQRCQVCGMPSYQQKVSCGGINSRTVKSEDHVRVWDINDNCAKCINRRIG